MVVRSRGLVYSYRKKALIYQISIKLNKTKKESLKDIKC
jgi:hypothetical protein